MKITGSWTYGGKEVDLKHLDWDRERETSESGSKEPIWVVDEGNHQ